AEGANDEYHPAMWINRYEGLRNFGTSIGHHNETMEHPVFLNMLTRGVLWAVDEIEE
ncbi:MAG: ThuA domain-containing protein, partial [Candidatus Hydrogenedentota bacterium]